MSFGFDPLEAEKAVKEVKDRIERTYIEVIVDWMKDGSIQPLSFTWDDGREFKIDKIISIREGHSLKVFSKGKRFYCKTGKRRYYLHYDGERWYVETKTSLSY